MQASVTLWRSGPKFSWKLSKFKTKTGLLSRGVIKLPIPIAEIKQPKFFKQSQIYLTFNSNFCSNLYLKQKLNKVMAS